MGSWQDLCSAASRTLQEREEDDCPFTNFCQRLGQSVGSGFGAPATAGLVIACANAALPITKIQVASPPPANPRESYNLCWVMPCARYDAARSTVTPTSVATATVAAAASHPPDPLPLLFWQLGHGQVRATCA